MEADYLLHVAIPLDLESAKTTGFYSTSSLDSEGFIHCCLPAQLDGVLERYFVTIENYLIVEIDLAELPEKLQPVYENTMGGEELFPHIYGRIPFVAMKIVDKKDNES